MSVDRGARSAPKQAAKDSSQREKAVARDGRFCLAEIRAGGSWNKCGAVSHATAHIYRRWMCRPVADHPDVVIRTCVECHDRLDGRIPNEPETRFPLAARRRAWDVIVKNSKETSCLGPRP